MVQRECDLDAVCLLSGGLDSATVLAIARCEVDEVHALTFEYGQRHDVEVDAARRVAAQAGVRDHRIVEIDLRQFGGSALTSDAPVPAAGSVGIPATYVPARNTIFLSYALAWTEVLGARAIYLGVNAVDYSGYPDCRPEYIQAYDRLANLATKAGIEGRRIEVRAPLLYLTKAEIIRRGIELGVDYSLTSSCYTATSDGACGVCDACNIRLRGFDEAGVRDPGRYSDV